MKYVSDRGFLHPVLGQRDYYYPNNKFIATLKDDVLENDQKFNFCVQFSLDLKAIKELVKSGKAGCIVWLYCSRTAYRKVFYHEKNKFEVSGEVPVELLRGKFELYPSIVAFNDLVLPIHGSHSDFTTEGTEEKSVSIGSPLAVQAPWRLNLDYETGTPIFRLEVNNELEEGAWDIFADPGDPFVYLRAHETTVQTFQEYKDESLAMSTLYLAGMTNALAEFMRSNLAMSTEIDSNMWAGVILRQLAEHKIEYYDDGEGVYFYDKKNNRPCTMLWVAQKLLEKPLQKSLKVNQINTDEEDEYE